MLANWAVAQKNSGGIKFGYNSSNMFFKEEKQSYTPNALPNFYFGAYKSYFTGDNFAFQPGLTFQGKGSKNQAGDQLRFHSLDIPLNFSYYIPASKSAIILSAGPYLALNLFGKLKQADGTTTKIDFDKDGGLKRIDAGLNYSISIKLPNSFLISSSYSLGLVNLTANSKHPGYFYYDHTKSYNRILSFGLAYEFNK